MTQPEPTGRAPSTCPPEGHTSPHAPGGAPEADPQVTLPAPARPAAPAFGEYDVIAEIGEGGMGRVYKAVDRTLGRFVAIKVLRSTDPFECSRFRGEAELIATLDHPHIVRIFAIDTAPDGRPYIVLEFAEGGSLDKELGGQPQEPRRAAETVEVLARAVQFAHEKGVIHRDLKPANVLRGKDKVLKLTDFGLAKDMEVSSGMTPSGAVMGTPSYMAPEQAEGRTREFGPTTDVYGLGAILYECLTGRPPFRGVNMVDTLEQVRWAEPAPPSRLAPRLPRDLSTICLKCLQKSPGRRYQTAAELADDLRRWQNGETIAARPAPTWERLVRHVRRRPWEAVALGASVLLVGLMIASWVTLERRSAQEAARQEKEEIAQQLRDTEKQAADRLIALQQADEARLRRQARGSLAALNTIRDLVLEGELRRTPKLEPLHHALSAYYTDLIAQKDAGFDRTELADGLVKVGDLFLRTGDKDKAQKVYAEAEALYRADPGARRGLAAVRLKAARVAFDRGDDAGTATAVEDAAALWAALAAAAPTPAERDAADRQLAEAWHFKGQLLARQRQFKPAADAYGEAIKLRDRLAGPALRATAADLQKHAGAQKLALEYLRDLGRGYGYRGDVLLDDRDPGTADRDYWKSHDIREKVVAVLGKDAKTDAALDARQQLARSWGNFAELHTRSQALSTARHFAQNSLAEHDRLVADDPTNAEYQFDRWGRLNQVFELNLLLGDHDLGELRAKLLKPDGDPSAADKLSRGERGTLAVAHTLRGISHAKTDPTAAQTELQKACDLFADLCADRPGVSVDPTHLYFSAAATALLAELNPNAKPDDVRWAAALDQLEEAVVKKRFRGRHPGDVAQFRPFAKLKGDERFLKILGRLRG